MTVTTARRAGSTISFQRRRRLDDDPARRQLVAGAVERAKAGDRDAVGFLYRCYADNVYGYVCSIVRDEHEAEDVTQQVFSKMLTSLDRYEARRVPFAAWILRIAHNAAIDHIRAKRGIPSDQVVSLDRPADDVAFDGRHSLRAALGELPEDQRRVVVMRHLVGLTPGEIATKLNKSENAVHGLHHRGRRALRERLAEMGAAPTTLRAAA